MSRGTIRGVDRQEHSNGMGIPDSMVHVVFYSWREYVTDIAEQTDEEYDGIILSYDDDILDGLPKDDFRT